MDFVKGDPLFLKTNTVPHQYPYLTQNIKTDVIIVGGGVTGAILGYYFTQNNINAVILEKSRIAHSSTSITTSLLQYELDRNASDLQNSICTSDVINAYKLGLSAIDEINRFVEINSNKCDFKRCDSCLFGTKQADKLNLYEEYTLRKNNDFDVEFVDESSNPFDFALSSGIISKNGGAVLDPYRFTHHLLEVSCKNGLRVFENSEVLKVEYDDNCITAKTIYGHDVRGKIIICATGYNTNLFTKRKFGTKATTFNIATKPIDNLSVVFKNTIFRDNLPVYHYFRSTPDNRIIMGGEDIRFIPDIDNASLRERSYMLLKQKLKDIFPMYDIEVDYKYCGAFESTFDDLGYVGRDLDRHNLWYCLGYGANGILFSVLGAQMLVKLYNGEIDENLYLFDMSRKSNG